MPRRRRPRAVAGAGVEVLLARGEELAKGWLVALVEDAPLEQAAAILSRDVAREGPRICDALIRAVCDEADLRRIQRDGVLEPLVSRAGELAGACTAHDAAHAVEALKDVVWSALRAELSHDESELLADAAERLALVTEAIRAAVLRRPMDRVQDEAEPGVREGEPFWIDALRDEIVIAGRAQSPLSLLIVELEEAARLVAVEPHDEAAATFGRFAQVVRTAVRRRDLLACETDSRAWIIACDTGRAGARALGTRIAAAVPAQESWRGAPLTVSVGLAVLGEDGDNAASLIDAAEQTRFAAAASGIGIANDAHDGRPDPPAPTLAS